MEVSRKIRPLSRKIEKSRCGSGHSITAVTTLADSANEK
jgi:hypothetical protein